jgi:hypothetical protein
MRRAPKPPTEPPTIGRWSDLTPIYTLRLPPPNPKLQAMLEKFRREMSDSLEKEIARLLSPPAKDAATTHGSYDGAKQMAAESAVIFVAYTFRRTPILYTNLD